MRQGWCIGLRLLVQLRANNQYKMEYHFISHYITIIDALTVFLFENEL